MVRVWRRVAQTALLTWAGTCACLALLTLVHVVVTQGSIAVLFVVPLLSFGAVMVLRIRGTPLNDVRASREVRALWQRADSTPWAQLYPAWATPWLKPAYALASAVIAWSLWSARNGVAGDRYYRVDHGPAIPISKSAWTALNASDARGFLTVSAVFAVAAIGLLRKPSLHRPEHEDDVLPR